MESPLSPADRLSGDKIAEENETLVSASSFKGASLNQQQRRRRGNKFAAPPRQQSFSREIGHAAAETYLLTRLSFKLLSYLGYVCDEQSLRRQAKGWILDLNLVAFHYYFSSQVRRSIVYGDQPRNRLDLYLPRNSDGLKPVVIFVTGGAWIIGYKAWGALLGMQLAERDIIVACLDYRNFPQGTISDMVSDVCHGIAVICNNIAELGGDPNKIYVMGQSAGAHISSCALLQQAVKESKGESISWSASQINAYFGLSGGASGAVRLLPRIILFHGTSDNSIPSDESSKVGNLYSDFPEARYLYMQQNVCGYTTKSRSSSRTDLDPLRGGKDELFDYLVGFIHADDKEGLARDAAAPPRRRHSKRAVDRLYKSLIMDDGRICACSRKYLFAFERNGSIAWALHLNYTCSSSIAPVHGGSSKAMINQSIAFIYLVAENKVLKVYPLRIGTNEAPVEVFFECAEEIVGIAASLSSSCVLINAKNRGLFAYRLYGQLFWSAGPVLYQHGYRQGCRRNVTDCYFTSAPVIDQCEASIFMINTVGEVYSLSIRGHHFKWIQDLSLYGNAFRLTAGNNGLLYVTEPDKALVLALDVSRGNVLWQGSIGPLSSADHEPVVDANGWISYSSLDGFLYSFSATGYLKKFPRSASWSSVMQVNPVLDCSGYAIYISQTEMEGKYSQKFADYTHVSALKPKNVVFTSLVPASGSIVWFESDPTLQRGQSSRCKTCIEDPLSSSLIRKLAVMQEMATHCLVVPPKLASSCAQVKPKNTSVYIGNKRTITLFLMMESVVLLILAVLVRFCCIFWKKQKLQGLDLGKFLEKRRSLRSKKKAFDKMITELNQKASEEEEALQKLGHLVKAREGIKRRLSTTYSLGRDGEGSSTRPKSLLPLHDGRSRSYSFQGSKKESVTIFHTLISDSSSSDEEVSSLVEEADDDLSQDEVAKGKGKAQVGGESSSDYGGSEEEYVMSPLFLKHSFSEIEEVKGNNDYDGDDSHSEEVEA
ncbi:hypothetical protein SASPL_142316 [Salvia splendens]|uniref:protein-S-isoprenylcysteine alpha-carbonyl methylesterase n=1 Tax=Salvia splendens TaxID=180675 RepID=A0A8X8WLG3_SALSN|nr:hypothetical protein SASPL_142316 [Salvia splendens]